VPQLFCPHCGHPHPFGAAFCPATGRPLAQDSLREGPDTLGNVVGVLRRAFALYKTHARALLVICSLLFVPASLAKSLAVAWVQAPLMETASNFAEQIAEDNARVARAHEAVEKAAGREPMAQLSAQEAEERARDAARRWKAATAPLSGFTRFSLTLLATFLTSFLLYGVILPLTQGALTVAVADRVRGGHAGAREVWMLLLRRVGRLLPTVLLSGLLTGLGFLLFVIPGVAMAVLFAFVSPVVLIEGRSGTAALRRSYDLVKGDWLRVVLVLISFAVVRWFAQLLASFLVPSGALFIGPFLGDLVTLVLMPVPVLGLVLVYEDIRRRTEGPADDRLARELDQLRRQAEG